MWLWALLLACDEESPKKIDHPPIDGPDRDVDLQQLAEAFALPEDAYQLDGSQISLLVSQVQLVETMYTIESNADYRIAELLVQKRAPSSIQATLRIADAPVPDRNFRSLNVMRWLAKEMPADASLEALWLGTHHYDLIAQSAEPMRFEAVLSQSDVFCTHDFRRKEFGFRASGALCAPLAWEGTSGIPQLKIGEHDLTPLKRATPEPTPVTRVGDVVMNFAWTGSHNVALNSAVASKPISPSESGNIRDVAGLMELLRPIQLVVVEVDGMYAILPAVNREQIQRTQTPTVDGGGTITLDLVAAPVQDAVAYMTRLTGQPIRLEGDTRRTVTIISNTPTPITEAYRLFLLALNVEGYHWTTDGEVLKITDAL